MRQSRRVDFNKAQFFCARSYEWKNLAESFTNPEEEIVVVLDKQGWVPAVPYSSSSYQVWLSSTPDISARDFVVNRHFYHFQLSVILSLSKLPQIFSLPQLNRFAIGTEVLVAGDFNAEPPFGFDALPG